MLEASAGTGKTYALAGLVTRYVAEGVAKLDEMLLITFGRAASQELRERVRDQLRDAERRPRRPGAVRVTTPACWATWCDGRRRGSRHARLRDALAGFDAATIATTHQFCQLVLRSLGVAGDTDAGVTLVDDLGDLVAEVVDDLYLQRFGGSRRAAPDQPRDRARDRRQGGRQPAHPAGPAGVRRRLDRGRPGRLRLAVLAEMERRKRRLGILGYDDLLTRLAAALADPDAPARQRMRRRWSVVMVDEFQDTDPVQWEVHRRGLQRAQHAGPDR